MTLWIYVLSGKELGRSESFDRSTVVVGRGEVADLRLAESTVSRKHARLRWHATGAIELEDLNSTAGTYLHGERVQRCWLSDGDLIRVGEVELRLRVVVGMAAQETLIDSPEAPEPFESELELEGAWEEPTVRPELPRQKTVGPRSPQAPFAPASPSPKPTPTIVPKERARPIPGPKGAQKTTAGSRMLQYSEHADAEARGGGDLAQRPGWMRGLAILLALACMAALAYGAFRLTQGVKGSRLGPQDPSNAVSRE